jgi:hypothetical protein
MNQNTLSPKRQHNLNTQGASISSESKENLDESNHIEFPNQQENVAHISVDVVKLYYILHPCSDALFLGWEFSQSCLVHKIT